jgi:hypothetical protein
VKETVLVMAAAIERAIRTGNDEYKLDVRDRQGATNITYAITLDTNDQKAF